MLSEPASETELPGGRNLVSLPVCPGHTGRVASVTHMSVDESPGRRVLDGGPLPQVQTHELQSQNWLGAPEASVPAYNKTHYFCLFVVGYG